MKKTTELLDSLGFEKTQLNTRVITSEESQQEYTDLGGCESALITLLRFNSGQVRETHAHDEIRLTFVRSGKVRFTLEDKTMELEAGDMIYLLPQTPHSFEVISEKPFQVMELVFPVAKTE